MINETLHEADQKMKKSVEATREEFAAIRAGRATPSMFSKITADYYGTPTPLQQLASFTAPEARIILISPYDQSAMAAIEKSIRDSDLGVNPANDGKVLRCVFPELLRSAARSTSRSPGASPRTAGSRCATCDGRPSRAWRSSRRMVH